MWTTSPKSVKVSIPLLTHFYLSGLSTFSVDKSSTISTYLQIPASYPQILWTSFPHLFEAVDKQKSYPRSLWTTYPHSYFSVDNPKTPVATYPHNLHVYPHLIHLSDNLWITYPHPTKWLKKLMHALTKERTKGGLADISTYPHRLLLR